MKRAIICWGCLVIFFPAVVSANEAAAISIPVFEKPDFTNLPVYSVVEVIRGDTITVSNDANTITAKLIGVDTPATVLSSKPPEQVGIGAYHFIRNLLIGEKVYLLTDPQQETMDPYKRTPAYIYRFPDGLFVNTEIIRQGYGRAYTETAFKYMEEFRQIEQFAKEVKKGLWSPETKYIDIQPPETSPSTKPTAAGPAVPYSGKPDAAAENQQKDVLVYIQRTGTTYHTASCRYLLGTRIPIPLSEARRHYTPCSVCKPPL
jgi:endonuclease YncB( thermonuclease family)